MAPSSTRNKIKARERHGNTTRTGVRPAFDCPFSCSSHASAVKRARGLALASSQESRKGRQDNMVLWNRTTKTATSGDQKAHDCPTPGKLWVVPPPIHSCVRPADHGGKFFVLCFQPVTVPCALCAQVTRASARETMATADSGSARDRHWKSRARRAPRTVQAYSPHSGDRRARPRPGTALEGSHLRAG